MLNHKDCQGKTDQELILLTLKNQDYYLCLMQRYEAKLFRYIKRISNLSDYDIEDLLQEIFIKIYKNLNDFDQNLKFSSWVYRIAHNQVISNWRKIEARPKTISFEDNEFIFNALISKDNPYNEIDQKFTSKNAQEILTKLDYKYREVLVLKYLEEKNYQEISDIIKKPLGTVATLINRAKEQFKVEAHKKNINFNI